ncbi:hypothetical protein T8J41_19465 (plasmid) [Nitratireductor rhodophyticola]|uniref:hypothetical protein n=1 Tax=Nitratireductor TaxID=245876 RepID=UPI0021072E10|nr:hypothetical protein [Nitratireductor rhodophyticola]MEC9244030.1 hypothetical protein [Pseudomonadota bacterium]WPZ16378.1 hypothetical protein T8J41_19465 [Nitratireductor rhodophyticola]
MSQVRPFEHDDAPAVAEMFLRILRRETSADGGAALAVYLDDLFCGPYRCDGEIVSRVHVTEDGRLNGFIGVLPQVMELDGEHLRAAICTTWMVDGHQADPFAGARLLKAVLSGPQDLSFSETSNDLSTAMWRRMGAHVLAPYSLEYLRVIRPAAFVTRMAANRFGLLGAFTPLARLADRAAAAGVNGLSWAGFQPRPGKTDALAETEPDEDALAGAIGELVVHHRLHPRWSDEQLARMLAHARVKARHGTRVQRILRTRGGKLAGLFVYYGDRGGIGRAMQVMAAPGMEGLVLERLLADAHARGLAAIRGRTQPALLDAMLDRKFAFLHASSTVFHSSRPQLADAATQGRAFLNGLSGESWTRLIGDRFD